MPHNGLGFLVTYLSKKQDSTSSKHNQNCLCFVVNSNFTLLKNTMLGVYGCLGASLYYGYLYISEKKTFCTSWKAISTFSVYIRYKNVQHFGRKDNEYVHENEKENVRQ